VSCHEFNPEGSWYKGDACAVCIFEFSNGAVFNYRGSWCAKGFNTSWDATWRLTASKGSILWNGYDLPVCEVDTSTEPKLSTDVKSLDVKGIWNGRDGHYGCLDEMFTALQEGRKAETDCADNIKSMAMVFGAIQSAREKRKVIL
jgi:predicted dehydrogenase